MAVSNSRTCAAPAGREVEISTSQWEATQRLKRIVLERVDLTETPLRDGVASLVKQINEKERGASWRFSFPDHDQIRALFGGEPESPVTVDQERPITLSLHRVEAMEALRLIALLGDCEAVFLDREIFLIRPEAEPLREKSFDAYAQIRPGMAHLKVIDAQPALEKHGIKLPAGGWATYHVDHERLDVRARGDDLDLVHALLHLWDCRAREYTPWEQFRLRWNFFPPPPPKGQLDLTASPYTWPSPSPDDPISPGTESPTSSAPPAADAPP